MIAFTCSSVNSLAISEVTFSSLILGILIFFLMACTPTQEEAQGLDNEDTEAFTSYLSTTFQDELLTEERIYQITGKIQAFDAAWKRRYCKAAARAC